MAQLPTTIEETLSQSNLVNLTQLSDEESVGALTAALQSNRDVKQVHIQLCNGKSTEKRAVSLFGVWATFQYP